MYALRINDNECTSGKDVETPEILRESLQLTSLKRS